MFVHCLAAINRITAPGRPQNTPQASLVATRSQNFRTEKSRLCLCTFTRFSGTITPRREAPTFLILQAANSNLRPPALTESHALVVTSGRWQQFPMEYQLPAGLCWTHSYTPGHADDATSVTGAALFLPGPGLSSKAFLSVSGLSSDVLQEPHIGHHPLDTSALFCKIGMKGHPRNSFVYCSSYKCQQRLYWNVR